jgi:capsular polysaccharide transport system permease protein
MEKGDQFIMKKLKKILCKSLVLYVFIPWLLFAIYQLFISAPRFESASKIIIKQPDGLSTMAPSMALLSGLGVNTTHTDIQLVKMFIESVDMVNYLEAQLNLSEHFNSKELSYLSKLYSIDNKDDLYGIYLKFINVNVDGPSGVITIKVQAYDAAYSRKLNAEIVKHSEDFINSIGHQLAKSQLTFINKEHQLTEEKLLKSKSDLLVFQRKYDLLDPEAEGVAIQTIAYELESSLSKSTVELKALQSVMSEGSLLVIAKKNELTVLKQQIDIERNRLSQNTRDNGNIISTILSEYSDLKINLELSLKAYMSSQISLEKSRIEAYRQLKHLVIIQTPTEPINNKYPESSYNIVLAFILLLMAFAITRIIFSTIKELS